MADKRVFFTPLVVFVVLSLGGGLNHPARAVSKIRQSDVPPELSATDGAVLEENDTFITVMYPQTIRVLSKTKAEIIQRDEEGDHEFIREHRNENGDYWYWAHQKAREALVLALGRQPKEAIKVIDTIPYNEALVPEYRWIVTPEFREYLEGADEDLAYYYDPYVGVTVFFTNYQVSQLEREYPTIQIRRGPDAGRAIRARIPILEINLRDLVATPRKGEEGKVGLDAILGVDPNGITDSLLPGSEEYSKRKPTLQDKLITASDKRLKQIPVATREVRDMLENLMQTQSFLKIEGSMRSDRQGTRFTEDLKIVVDTNSPLAQFLTVHRKALGSADVKRAQ